MITVYYEMYWNDYRKRNDTDSFISLSNLEDWIFNQMQQNYTQNSYVMSFPTPESVKRINEEGPWAIEFSPTWEGPRYIIHKITSGTGIIFTDGKFTAGQKHWSAEVQNWLKHCCERQQNPEFCFVE